MYSYNNNCNGLNLPDTSSSEKALMWSATGHYSESGYSTQAPSISSIDAFLNNEPQQPQQQQSMDNNTQQYAQLEPAAAAAKQEPTEQEKEENAVENWMKCRDNSEMALKAMPDLLQLLLDEDTLVVQQATVLINQATRVPAARMGLIQTPNAVNCLVDSLNTTADIETAKNLVGALYGISFDKQSGVQAIMNSKALPPLIKMLNAPCETIINLAITTLHNVLVHCPDAKWKSHMRKMGAVHHIVPLLGCNQNAKMLAIAIDCLHSLAFGNQEAKQVIHEMGAVPVLLSILVNHASYQKLVYYLSKLLKCLSADTLNKQTLVQCNAMQALSMHLLANLNPPPGLNPATSHEILQHVLVTLRNLSDAAVRLGGMEQLVQTLVQLMATCSVDANLRLAADILANLTIYNESNKVTAIRANAVKYLLKIVAQTLPAQKFDLAESCLTILRHLTQKNSDMLLAQEQLREVNGLALISPVLKNQPDSWACVKQSLGLVRTLCMSHINASQLRANNTIEKLMQVLYSAYIVCQAKTNNGMSVPLNLVVKVNDVNLLDIIDSCSVCLLHLAKDFQNQNIMKQLDCIAFFVQLFFSPIMNNQKAGISVLAELASNKACAEIIEQTPGLSEYVQANFCNQFGMLKSIAELSNSGAPNQNATLILQYVTTLMQRLQEHKRVMQQQQQVQVQQQQVMQQQSQQFVSQQEFQQSYYNGYHQQQNMGYPNQFY